MQKSQYLIKVPNLEKCCIHLKRFYERLAIKNSSKEILAFKNNPLS